MNDRVQDFFEAVAESGHYLAMVNCGSSTPLYVKTESGFDLIEATAGEDILSRVTSELTRLVVSVMASRSASTLIGAGEAEELAVTPANVKAALVRALEKASPAVADAIRNELIGPATATDVPSVSADVTKLQKKYKVGGSDGRQLPASGEGNRSHRRAVRKGSE